MEPLHKAPKLSLSEAAEVLNQQNSNFDDVNQKSSDGVLLSRDERAAEEKLTLSMADFSQEEEEENSQIQASLPLYFDHMFGTYIGHSQSQAPLDLSRPHCCSPQQQQHRSLCVSTSDTQLLDSQGFIFNSSSPHVSSPLSSPTQCQFQLSDTKAITKTQTITSLLSPTVSTSPSSDTSSPSNRSNRSGTPVLFPSPAGHSPESIILQTLQEKQATHKQQCHDDNEEPLLTVPCSCAQQSHCSVSESKDGKSSCQDLKTNVLSRSRTVLHESQLHPSTSRKRKLNFNSVSSSCSMNKLKYTCPPCCTLLADCTHIQPRAVSVFAIVLQVNPVMEVACKSNSKTGYTVPMSSLLLGDPTKSYFKLSLWREAAAWVERISAGDVVLLRNIRLKSWQREFVGTTVMYSSILNLHQPKKQLPDKVRTMIPGDCLNSLLQWGRRNYGYLFANPSLGMSSQKPVCFLSSCDLGKESLIHFRAKVLLLISNQILLVADEPGVELYLYLLCVDASLWRAHLSGGLEQVWEFMYIAVTLDGATQGGGYSLQTTTCSFLRPLPEDCQQATDILTKFLGQVSVSSFVTKECTVADLTSGRLSGVVEIEARVVSAWFLLCDGTRFDLCHAFDVVGEQNLMISQLCQCVYIGCESCSAPLKQDANGVYCQCLSCMLKKPGGYPSLAYFFRPMMLALQDSTGLLSVTVNHATIPKVLGVSAYEVVKASLAQSEELNGVGEILRKTTNQIQACTSDGTTTTTKWIINCATSKDENSFLEAICCTLLDTVI